MHRWSPPDRARSGHAGVLSATRTHILLHSPWKRRTPRSTPRESSQGPEDGPSQDTQHYDTDDKHHPRINHLHPCVTRASPAQVRLIPRVESTDHTVTEEGRFTTQMVGRVLSSGGVADPEGTPQAHLTGSGRHPDFSGGGSGSALLTEPVQLYDGLVRLHLVPVLHSLGVVTVADVKEGIVRKWRKKLLDSGVGAVTVAKAYRLLKSIMNTAVDDGLIKRNPCRIDGAGQEHSPERPILTVYAGLRPGRRVHRPPLPAADPARRVLLPALGRAGRARRATASTPTRASSPCA